MTTRTATDWPLVLLLWLAGLGAAAQYGKVAVVYDRLGVSYPDAGAVLGFAVSLVGFLGMFLGVVAGLIVARIRYRRALVWALWLGAALSALQAVIPPLPVFLVSRGVEGISHLAIVVAAPTLIAELTAPRDTGRTLTLWGTFFGVAFAVLTFLGLPLVERYGIPALFAVHAAFMAAMAVILMVSLPKGAAEISTEPLDPVGLLKDHVRIYRSPRIAASGIGWLFYTFTFVSVLTLLPQFLDPGLRAAVIGAMPLLSIASSLTLGIWLMRRHSAVGVVVAGFTAAAGVAALMVGWPGAAILCLAFATALGLVQGASFAAVAELNESAPDRAAGYGAMAQTGNIGNTLGTPVMAAMIGAAGHTGFAWSIAVVLALGAICHLWLATLRR